MVGGFFEPATALEMSKPGCVICEFAMQQVNRLTDGDFSNADFVASAVNNVCAVMPHGVTVSSLCLIPGTSKYFEVTKIYKLCFFADAPKRY